MVEREEWWEGGGESDVKGEGRESEGERRVVERGECEWGGESDVKGEGRGRRE